VNVSGAQHGLVAQITNDYKSALE